jgi:Major Facilitator Superfamily
VYGETKDPLATSGLFLAAQFLPAFGAPALTAKIDQTPLRRTLTGLYLAEALLFVGLALLAEHFALWAVLLLTFIDGALMLTARGLTRGAVSAILQPTGALRQGNGLLNLGFAIASVLGAALGGVLVDRLGVTVALLVDAGSFALVALLLGTSSSLPLASEEREPFWLRIRDGIRHASHDTAARALLGGEALAVLLFSLIVPIEIVYAKETLGTSDAGFGALLAAWCVGIVIGSLLYIAFRGRSAVGMILLSTSAIGVAYLGMAVVTTLGAACALSILGGAGNGVQWVSVMTLLQERTPADLQARITGLLESLSSAAIGAGYLLGGIIVALTSPPLAYAISGAGVLLLVAAGAAWASRMRLAAASPASSESTDARDARTDFGRDDSLTPDDSQIPPPPAAAIEPITPGS